MAKVLSSISGNLISAASAGYAPTNSADVSAIASAYQVVSATGTQLYAGTAHVTSVNSAPISASRAGNAANAGMANSAYYDGTGRLISSLPDSATVSSIASSYADGKADASALSSYALSADVSGTINTVATNSASWGQGGVVTATGSAWDNAYFVTSVNGSSLWAAKADVATNDSDGRSITATYVPKNQYSSVSSCVVANSAHWNSVYNTVSSNSASWSGSTGGSVSSPSGTIVVNGSDIEGTNSAVLTASVPGFTSTGYLDRPDIPDWGMVRLIPDVLPGTGGVLRLSAGNTIYSADILLSGQGLASNFVTATATVTGNTRDIVIPLGAMVVNISASASQYISMGGSDVYTAEKSGGIQVTGLAELAWKSAVDDVTNTVSANSASWGQGGVDSATVSSIASSYAQSAASSKQDSSAMSAYALSSDVSGVIDTVSSNSASWAGGTVSLPITGSAGSETATYDVTSVSFVRNDTAGEPDIRTATLSPDQFQISYTYNNADYTSMTLSEYTLDFSDSDGSHVVDAYSIDSWNSAVDTVANNSASWGQSGPVTSTASAKATAYTSTSTYYSAFTGISSVNGSALLVSNMLPNAQQANGNAHFHFMPTTSPWGSTEYPGVLSPLQYATGACLAMKQQDAYGAYYKGNEWFISDIGSNTAANGVVRAELHRTRGIHLYGSSLNSATGFHINGSGIDGKSGASAWQYGPTEYNMLIDVNNTVSNNSATWGQGGGIDSADCSAIASSYANDVSAAVSSTVDTVSSQSANWGGSALALSAGSGVKLEKVGNTLVASTDETVLWSGFEKASGTVHSLSESMSNFERVKFVVSVHSADFQRASQVTEYDITNNTASFTFFYPECRSIASNTLTSNILYVSSDRTAKWTLVGGLRYVNTALTTGVGTYDFYMNKIIGVKRTAGV